MPGLDILSCYTLILRSLHLVHLTYLPKLVDHLGPNNSNTEPAITELDLNALALTRLALAALALSLQLQTQDFQNSKVMKAKSTLRLSKSLVI